MKKHFLFVLLLLLACEPDENTPTGPVTDNFDTSQATLLKQGTMEGVGHTVSGTASLYESSGKKYIVLAPFSSQNGPDLKVYFSSNPEATTYLNLGELKSTMGKQTYEVPGGADVAAYSYVHIWCEQFTVVFGIAELK